MKFRNWNVRGFDRSKAEEFYHSGVNPLVSVLLVSRDFADIKDVQTLISDDPAVFYDPFLMADMNKAVTRIHKAVKTGERIAIYGDYDVDGMTSSALLALWLRSKGADFSIYIPGRFDEGYGLNKTALDELKKNGVQLVVTVDCGITAIEEARHAESIGLDLVITDHHECRDTLPEACAVVDPKRPDCDYPYKSLAGVGVAFKLVSALEGDHLSDEMFRRYSELVAIGTVADVMPVMGENRELIKRGLNILNTTPRPGVRRLLQEVNTDLGKVTAATIGFSIAPRLNAAGRMGKSGLSVDLLLTENIEESDALTMELCSLNTERRNLEQRILEEATEMLPDGDPDRPIVLAHRDWYQGVTGIVAAKMAERYQLPAIIISIDNDGLGRGSCRSYGTFPIYDALCACEDILDNYGGHEMAAGVTVAEKNIEALRQHIVDYYQSFYKDSREDKPGSELILDFEVTKPELLTMDNIKALDQLEPFGNKNPLPRLCMTKAVVLSTVSIGSGQHSRLKIDKSGTALDCIFFSVPVEDLGVKEGSIVDVAFEPQVNEFRGRSSVQLQLLDIRESEPV